MFAMSETEAVVKRKPETTPKIERKPTNRMGSSSITATRMIGCVLGLAFIDAPPHCFAGLVVFHVDQLTAFERQFTEQSVGLNVAYAG
jgi:hypothetical protein